MSKTSPSPWAWDPAAHSANVLRAADGVPVVTYDRGWLEPGGAFEEGDKKLIAAAPAMAEMLRELEWAGNDAVSMCPVCGMMPEYRSPIPGEPIPGRPGFVAYTGQTKVIPGGHAPDCKLAALLKAIP